MWPTLTEEEVNAALGFGYIPDDVDDDSIEARFAIERIGDRFAVVTQRAGYCRRHAVYYGYTAGCLYCAEEAAQDAEMREFR